MDCDINTRKGTSAFPGAYVKQPITSSCIKCGHITTFSSQWNLTRKTFPELCKACSNAKRQNVSQPWDTLSKDWNIVYNDPNQTADTLSDAKRDSKPYYKRDCVTHGAMPYATRDNTCRKCTREQQRVRNATNISFNRPRVILGSAKRRSKAKGIDFNITVDDIRGHIPETCPVLGTPISYDADTDTSPSLDRFDSSQGYTKDNVKIISTRANRIKSDGMADEHIQVAMWMLMTQGLSYNMAIEYIKATTKNQHA